MSPRKSSGLTLTDQFCGAGGSSLGALRAGADVRLALNHWDRACETYAANHPATDIDRTDISACDPRRYPSTDILLTSPECTNHSLAKGVKKYRGQDDLFTPRDIDPAADRSRATMWDVWRFAEYHDYRAIIVENVVDARSWVLWDAWWRAGLALGYEGRCVYLNSMHAHPTPQSRDRMYVVWWKRKNRAPDLDIHPCAWCQACERDVEAVQAWKRPDRPFGKYRKQYVYVCPACARQVEPYYYAALNALDLSIPAERIGDRPKPLQPRTMARIAYGLEKFGRQPIYLHVSQGGGGRGHEMEGRVRGAAVDPALAQTASNHYALATPWLVDTLRTNDGGARAWSAEDPTRTQTSRRELGVAYMVTAGSRETAPVMPTDAAGTMTGTERFAVVQGAKVMTLRDRAGGFLHSALTDPTYTQVGVGQTALVQRAPYLIQYYGQMQASGALGAVPTQSSVDKHGVVSFPPMDRIAVEDLYFRMMAEQEIQRVMAFPDSYQVTGTKREVVKQLGNAVTPPSMHMLVDRVLASLAPELAA